ncbi:MAG: hypothetical protein ACI82I_002880 [Gammaproteobacteria bacterium]|jgi:hypothetical protein
MQKIILNSVYYRVIFALKLRIYLSETIHLNWSHLGEGALFYHRLGASKVQTRIHQPETKSMLTRRKLIGLLAVSPLFARPAFAASSEIFAVDGVAIRGTDPVAYFDQMAPVAGSADHSLMWKGAQWRFSSAGNLDIFEANPMAYAPQYGGYCAFALSKGALATTDPDAWTIYDGKLYLNYSTNVRKIWSQDIPGNIALADANWPTILGA